MRLTIRPCGEKRGRESWTSASGANTFASPHAPQASRSGAPRAGAARAEQAGVVDEEVDRLAGSLHEPAAVVGIGDVARDRDHAGEAGDRMLERLRASRVDGELPAALGKSASERES